MPVLPVQILTLVADLLVFIFVGYYFLKLRSKEQELKRKENQSDTNYHQIVDDALTKERKILSDATSEADHIISGAKHINDETKAMLDQALQKMVTDMHQQSVTTANYYMKSYATVLQQLANSSLGDFQTVTRTLGTDMQKQINDFRGSMLPTLEKELAAYKETRMKETEAVVMRVVQKASQEILNKSLSLEDHQKLMLDALEKAKKEGVFE